MSTTDQPTRDGQAPVADAGWAVFGLDQVLRDATGPEDGPRWAVPGVDLEPPHEDRDAGTNAAQDIDPDIDPATVPDLEARPDTQPDRDSAEAAEAAVAAWRAQLDEAADHRAGEHVHPVIMALATCLEALDGVRETGVATLTAREIRLMLLAVVQVITAAFALKPRLVVAGHAVRVADLTGATCTAAFSRPPDPEQPSRGHQRGPPRQGAGHPLPAAGRRTCPGRGQRRAGQGEHHRPAPSAEGSSRRAGAGV